MLLLFQQNATKPKFVFLNLRNLRKLCILKRRISSMFEHGMFFVIGGTPTISKRKTKWSKWPHSAW
jgi:hypothetical protein